MKVTRKTLVSAGVVGVVLAGGVSVTAAASEAGVRGAEVGRSTGAKVSTTPHDTEPSVAPHDAEPPGSTPGEEPSPSTPETPPAEDYIVSEEVNPDSGAVLDYWTEDRLEEAEPFPLPAGEGQLEVHR
ncbi:hypothetical protein [Streptosporangium fragile]